MKTIRKNFSNYSTDQLFDLNCGVTTVMKELTMRAIHEQDDLTLTKNEWAGVYMLFNLQQDVQGELKARIPQDILEQDFFETAQDTPSL